ncbi:phosphoenolpyruvate--protein phosphotransferase [bacterium]|nr:phosphoenolpyruvate--protein phosphotransferase [bacterium]
MVKDRHQIKGEKIVEGIGIGALFYIDQEHLSIPHISLHGDKALEADEVTRFKEAIISVVADIDLSMNKDAINKDVFAILEVHKMMIQDPMILDKVAQEIDTNSINAEWAIINVIESIASVLTASAGDYYGKAKVADLTIVEQKLISSLTGQSNENIFDYLPKEDVIICAHSLTVSDLNELASHSQVQGVVLEIPGGVSHLTIVLRALDIPSVLGVPSLISALDYGDSIIVDGLKGEVILRPSAKEITNAKKVKTNYQTYFNRFLEGVEEPSISRDGYHMDIGGNIEVEEDVPQVLKYGGDHIGLFRTELLYLDAQNIPDEDTQYELFYKVLHATYPAPVTVRIFDFGGDKEGNILNSGGVMGMRGIRFLPNAPHVFDPQIRALIRVAELGNLKIMLPFVSAISEIDDFKAYLYRHAEDLGLLHHLEKISIGAMIEIPAALFIAEQIAAKVDFFSVGTNDLIQYMMAVERHNKTMSEYFSHFHPALLRALYNLAHIARSYNIKISICGEMGADPHFTLMFMAMGITGLSMSAHSIPIIKKIIKNSYIFEGKELLNDALLVESVEEMRSLVHDYMAKKFPHIFYKTWAHTVEEVD